MANSQVYQLLQSLTSTELAALPSFLEIPTLKIREGSRRLLDAYLDVGPPLPEQEPNKKTLYNYIYQPAQPLENLTIQQDQQVRVLKNDLLKSTRRFLAFQGMELHPELEFLCLQRLFSIRRQSRLVQQEIKRGLRFFDRHPVDDPLRAATYSSTIFSQNLHYYLGNRRAYNQTPSSFQQAIRSSEEAYLMFSLQVYLGWEEYYSMHKGSVGKEHLSSLLERATQFPNNSLLQICTWLLRQHQFSVPPSLEEFRSILEQIKQIHSSLPPESKYLLLTSFRNRIAEHAQKQPQHFEPLLIEVFMLSLRANALSPSGQLAGTTFLNIATLLIKHKQFQELEEFVQAQKLQLPPSEQKPCLRLVKAHRMIVEQQYKKARRLLLQWEGIPFPFQVRFQVFDIYALFHLSQKDETYNLILTNRIKAYLKFIARASNDKGKRTLSPLWNMGVLVNKLFQHRNKSRRQVEELYEEIKQTTTISKDWLLEQCEQLLDQATAKN